MNQSGLNTITETPGAKPSGSGPGLGVRQAVALTAGGTTTIDPTTANYFVLTFGAGNTTLALAGVPDGLTLTLSAVQDGVGSRIMTWPATFKWVGGAAPTLSTGAGKRDNVRLVSDGTNLYEISRALDVR